MVDVRMTDSGPARYNSRRLSAPVAAGEIIDVEESVAERLTANSFFEYVDADDDNEAGEPVCGVNDCSRLVDAPEDTCWQHEDG